MLVISNAMGKSASSVLFWYTRELMQKGCPENGLAALEALTKSGEISGIGNYVSPLTDENFERVLEVSRQHGPIVVKTHSPLTPKIQTAIENNEAICTYGFRDPRDMILSAVDHYHRKLAEGVVEFQGFNSVSESMPSAKWWCELSCKWIESGLATLFRYEEIVGQPRNTIKKIRDLLGYDVDNDTIDQFVRRDEANRTKGRNQFNRGVLTRFREEMTPQEIALCHEAIGDYILRMGYSLDIRVVHQKTA